MKATTPGAMSPRLVSDVVAAAVGHWPDLLAAVGIDIPRRGKHGPCPACGGKDRFRLDDKGGRGTWICNQCGNGDGLDLLVRVTGKSTKEAAELLAPLVSGMEQPPHPRRLGDERARTRPLDVDGRRHHRRRPSSIHRPLDGGVLGWRHYCSGFASRHEIADCLGTVLAGSPS